MARPETKTALLDEAERQIRMKGVDGFSYADLSKAIGIRKASIHYHFPAKADLLTETMLRYGECILAALQELCETRELAGQRLAGFIDLYRAALRNGDMFCLCVALSISDDGLTKDTLDVISEFRSRTTEWLEEVFEVGKLDGSISGVGQKSAEALSVMAIVEGAQIGARFRNSPLQYDKATQMLRDRIV